MPLAKRLAELYDETYYHHHLGPHPYERSALWIDFFRVVATRIRSDIGPREVMDVGCAIGLLVEQLRLAGVTAWGFDVSEYAIAQVLPEYQEYCWVGSAAERGAYKGAQHVGLVTCIEVAEHMTPQDADYAIGLMCSHAVLGVLFSSSPYDYEEPTHINVQQPDYWARQFARHGFYHDLMLDVSFVSPWAMLFRPEPRVATHELVARYEARLWEQKHQIHEQRKALLQTLTEES